MRYLSPLLLLAVVSCGGAAKSPCDACGTGTRCDVATRRCVADTMTPQCTPACTGSKPVCDAVTNAQNPHCVQCMTSAQCSGGATCSSSQTCIGGGAGGGMSGSGGGGIGSGGGVSGTGGGSGGGAEMDGGTGGTGGSAGGSGGSAGGTGGTGGGFVTSSDAGSYTGIGSCAPQDGGVVGTTCVPSCPEGLTCVNGACQLNGANGPVQVTLRWNTTEDVDLHVLEPLPAGGTCEIYYGDTNQPGDPSSCGAVGSLDLDSEAGCANDNIDIENVIYPPAVMAPRGTYSVYVDHYANCSTVTVVPFEVEARFNGTTVGLCGVFRSTDPDWENANSTSGRLVMQFTIP